MWESLTGRTVLITGATGFLGTALVHRLITSVPVAKVYLLCRGDLPDLAAKWKAHLHEKHYAMMMHDNNGISVLQGDITKPDLGLDPSILQTLQNQVNVVIHAASSINLAHGLDRLSGPIIDAGERMARLALSCHHLERFVYVSTAYANSFLYQETHDVDVRVNEEIYPLGRGWQTDVWDEWTQVQTVGFTMEMLAHDFPWPYAYAKHLTERLVLRMFSDAGRESSLLILRPSIIAPAQSFPHPGFSVARSTPSTLLAVGFMLTPFRRAQMSSRAQHPDVEATIDEVPVDVVVDRLLIHLDRGSSGPVHAVSGLNARYTLPTFWEAAKRQRRLPWGLHRDWKPIDWHSRELHPLAQLYVIIGTSYNFVENKTDELYQMLDSRERANLQLYTTGFRDQYDFSSRQSQILSVAEKMSSRTLLSFIVFWLFYMPWFSSSLSRL